MRSCVTQSHCGSRVCLHCCEAAKAPGSGPGSTLWKSAEGLLSTDWLVEHHGHRALYATGGVCSLPPGEHGLRVYFFCSLTSNPLNAAATASLQANRTLLLNEGTWPGIVPVVPRQPHSRGWTEEAPFAQQTLHDCVLFFWF